MESSSFPWLPNKCFQGESHIHPKLVLTNVAKYEDLNGGGGGGGWGGGGGGGLDGGVGEIGIRRN
jgi:hypothetical protein